MKFRYLLPTFALFLLSWYLWLVTSQWFYAFITLGLSFLALFITFALKVRQDRNKEIPMSADVLKDNPNEVSIITDFVPSTVEANKIPIRIKLKTTTKK